MQLIFMEIYIILMSVDNSRKINKSAAQNWALLGIICMLESHEFNCTTLNILTPNILEEIQNQDFDYINEAKVVVQQIGTLNLLQREAFNQLWWALRS